MQRWKPFLLAAGATAALGARSLVVLVIDIGRDAFMLRPPDLNWLPFASARGLAMVGQIGPFVASKLEFLQGATGRKGESSWGELHCTRCIFRASAAPVR